MNRITLLASEIPFPPFHGGRIDLWNRLLALKELDIKVQLICCVLPNEIISSEQKNKISEVVSDFILIQRHNSFLHLLQFKFPARMLSFFLDKNKRGLIYNKVVEFSPKFLWLDGWSPYLLAIYLKSLFAFPLVYRSHNIEHQYFLFQAKLSRNIKKLILYQNAFYLKRVEPKIRESADFVFDISKEDSDFWKTNKNKKTFYDILPFQFYPKEKFILSEIIYDFGFVGSLWTPNNVNGLKWFVLNVLPIIKENITAKINIYFAGSNPTDEVKHLCQTNNIVLIENPEFLNGLYSSTKVLINPTLYASGINIKMVEMLYYGNEIVCTKQTMRGIPEELHKYIFISKSKEDFANNCVRALSSNNKNRFWGDERMVLTMKFFGKNKMSEIIQKIGIK
ncbi:MAG: glycosyltransferase [Stygiobacter sp.]